MQDQNNEDSGREFRIYIIGHIPKTITIDVKNKFEKAVNELKHFNASIINPIDTLIDERLKKPIAYRFNFNKLCSSHAVYILNEGINNANTIPEIKIALRLDLLILHQCYSLVKQKPIDFKNVDRYIDVVESH